MKSRALIKNIKLPSAPGPTRANFHKHPVVGDGKFIKVLPTDYKPQGALELKRKPIDEERAREIAKQREETLRKAREVQRAKAAEREKRIIDMYNAGYSNMQIAEAENSTPKSISSKICKLRRDGVLKEREMPEYEKTVIRMYEEGVHIRNIAEAVGMKESQVNTLLVKLRKHGKVGNRCIREWPDDCSDELIRLWNEGYKQRDIARLMGVCNSKIFYHTARLQEEGRIERRK